MGILFYRQLYGLLTCNVFASGDIRDQFNDQIRANKRDYADHREKVLAAGYPGVHQAVGRIQDNDMKQINSVAFQRNILNQFGKP